MSRIPDLNLIGSLKNHKITRATIENPSLAINTIGEAADYWMRHKRGQGWTIVTTALDTYTALAWEHSRSEIRKRKVGRLSDNHLALAGICSQSLLYIVTVDQWTPDYVYQIAQSLTTQNDSRILCLELFTKMQNMNNPCP